MPAYQWLVNNEIPVRGHCIIWPGWHYLPDRLRHYENDPEMLRRLCEERIDSLLAEWSGKLAEWDVVNEVYMQDDLLEICGREILVDWFKQVRRLDPDAKLYYNDANTLANHQPGRFELRQYAIDRREPHVLAAGVERVVHILSTHVLS